MKWMLLALILFSSFLLFTAILQLIFLSNSRLDKRMKHYLSVQEKKMLDRNKFNLIVQMQITKQKIRTQVLTKDKNNRLEVLISRAGLELKPEEYVLFQWILTAFLAGLSFLIFGNVFFALLGGITGFVLPKWYLNKKQKERLRAFNESLPDMITTIIGSLRAGFSFPQALKTVVEEANSPIKEEMETVLREMQYGSNIEESLQGLKDRMPSDDLDLMIQAILIQRQVGGNLATVLDKIVETIRDRTKIQRQIVTLTAQGRLSGIVIGLLPVILGCVLYLIEPDYIGTLFTNVIGIIMLSAGVISSAIGFVFIRKLTTIEV
ncbi:tight adherence protein B [Bacillus mesophilus]|uniref:Type II secretion system protein n=1 Tax=Bacillus mesophilus TaxID=1808955 RepID=A0A6M0Q3R4_9BACI|nr:type II secretion system F family protein [Bacillus mesophilus]MBM7660294.1 tight adherence protein B [Bacillus mesophilus]NEY71007.1 type II secretion system protein [Bacillus mesophilus]